MSNDQEQGESQVVIPIRRLLGQAVHSREPALGRKVNMYKNMFSSRSTGGIGFVGVLTIVFITLKLVGYISWPWWWVLSPLWVGAILLVVGVLLIVLLVALKLR